MKGWILHTETPRVEVTQDGTLPPYKPDIVRRWIPGKPTAWLEGPQGERIELTEEQLDIIWGADEGTVKAVLGEIIGAQS